MNKGPSVPGEPQPGSASPLPPPPPASGATAPTTNPALPPLTGAARPPAASTPPPEPPAPPPARATVRGPASASTDDDLAALLSQIGDDEVAPAVGPPLRNPTDVERPERAQAAHIDTDGGIDFDPELASYGARLGGLIIDNAVTTLCLLPGVALAATGSTGLVIVGILLMAVGFVGATVLYARGVAANAQGIGNRVMNTAVVDARNGRTIGVGEAALRFAVRWFVSSILLFGFLMAFGNSQRRTLHDNIAGTVVTRPPRAVWSIDDEAAGD